MHEEVPAVAAGGGAAGKHPEKQPPPRKEQSPNFLPGLRGDLLGHQLPQGGQRPGQWVLGYALTHPKLQRCDLSQALSGWLSQVCLRPSLGPGGSDDKESACRAGDRGSIPGLGRCPGGGRGNPLQYSCLENPHGQRSLAGCSPRVAESEATE